MRWENDALRQQFGMVDLSDDPFAGAAEKVASHDRPVWDMSDWVGEFEELKGQLAGDGRIREVEARLDQLFPEKRLGR